MSAGRTEFGSEQFGLAAESRMAARRATTRRAPARAPARAPIAIGDSQSFAPERKVLSRLGIDSVHRPNGYVVILEPSPPHAPGRYILTTAHRLSGDSQRRNLRHRYGEA